LAARRKYIKRASNLVVAVQLDLDTSGFSYRKWGGMQICKPGDWIVNNEGDVYTVDRQTFDRTYHAESTGLYRKVAPVWAEVADHDGAIKTKEGLTHYKAGDYLVFNDEEGEDGYAVTAVSFKSMYEPAG
jgi:hypothetical protein